ncbi:hypothetical protein [Streptacidiphilus monticola]|uniref:SWIM-type domain-containing protein n=1 Tax=Streptacidiphilus monticola TaxID=2161674 RepID=A0ABW1GC12_9ACTN
MRAWSERLLTRIEVLGIGSGLSADAMRGAGSGVRRVAELTVGPGSVHAVVEEQQDRFETWADLAVWDAEQWQRAEQAVARPPSEALRLLTQGQFPPDLDASLARAGLSLLPGQAAELSLECTCPARDPDCRHLAAVLGAFADRVDADPFLLTTWRGREKNRLLHRLRRLPARPPLAGFWVESAPYPEPEPQAPGRRSALEELGPSGISIRGRALEHWLAPAYAAMRDEDEGQL